MATGRAGPGLLINKDGLRLDAPDKEKHQCLPSLSLGNRVFCRHLSF